VTLGTASVQNQTPVKIERCDIFRFSGSFLHMGDNGQISGQNGGNYLGISQNSPAENLNALAKVVPLQPLLWETKE